MVPTVKCVVPTVKWWLPGESAESRRRAMLRSHAIVRVVFYGSVSGTGSVAFEGDARAV